MKPVKIAIVGCGKISGAYLNTFRRMGEYVEVVACADTDAAAARSRAEEFGLGRATSVEEALADPGIEIVVSLTPPAVHAPLALAAIAAGKSFYTEKPLAVTREEGAKVLEAAAAKGVRVSAAPDTFLGAGLQTSQELIESGGIGEPVAASAFLLCHGHEHWHPNPAFYYQPGGGPMFDMGPYYLTALIQHIGPIRSIAGFARTTFPERTVTSEPRNGEVLKVETPTHIAGTIDFANGAIGTVITSFDVWGSRLPRIEIYGTEGTLSLPDPNTFGGPVFVQRGREKEWKEVEVKRPYAENGRGLGVVDMACAIRTGRPHRASGEMAFHVLDAMHAFLNSSGQTRYIRLDSTCDRPAPIPVDLAEGEWS